MVMGIGNQAENRFLRGLDVQDVIMRLNHPLNRERPDREEYFERMCAVKELSSGEIRYARKEVSL